MRKRNVMRRVAGKAVRFLIAAFVAWHLAQAADITIIGNWSLMIGAADLQGGPGSDLNPSYQSAANQITMDVTTRGQWTWRVDVNRIDSGWNAAFQLFIRRTNNGTSGNGSVSGGTAYLQITTTSQTFVTGQGDRRGITLQERLDGVSVSVPPATYTTTIQYTVVDT